MLSLKQFIYRLRGEVTTEELISRGLKVGKNFKRLNNVIIDDSHTWLITIGDDVTLAPNVHILAHDASMKGLIGYTKIGLVNIGNNVFIGAGSIVLPGVTIGDNVVIGAGSVVTSDIPSNSVAVGNPANVIGNIDAFISKKENEKNKAVTFDSTYTMRDSAFDDNKKKMMIQSLKESGGVGYVE